MGPTDPPYAKTIDRLQHDWRDYRRCLRTPEQAAFDALFQKARAHAHASSHANRVNDFEPFLLSILLENETELQRLRAAAAREGGAP